MTVTFEGIKYAFRQTKDGHVLSFVVHPNDLTDSVILAPIGSRVKVTLSEISEQQASTTVKPGRSETAAPEKGKRWSEMSRAQQAGVLCGDPDFQRFLGIVKHERPSDFAAELVRQHCGVKSRADLDADHTYGHRWDSLVSHFRQSSGREAEQRGG